MTRDGVTVLVVDDDFRVAALHEAFVQRVEGFHVVGKAHTAAQALELAESLRPDLVLMDIYLPDMDGLRTLQEMFQRPSPPAAMIISAANDVANVRSALRLGVTHYLVKPFSFAQLAERLVAFRDRSARIDELPEEATQGDINHIFDMVRPAATSPNPEHMRLAPTLQVVYDFLVASKAPRSATELAEELGMSRATAQRSLTQLEHSGTIVLELRYGRTGRPEHLYSIRQRND